MGWKPSAADFAELFERQNPWIQRGAVPDDLAPSLVRPFADVLFQEVLNPSIRRFQLILGPRRVGKTTVMYQIIQRLIDRGVSPRKLFWLRLDHPLLMEVPIGQLVEPFLTEQATRDDPIFLFLDELAYAEKWDLWLKTFYDESWPVRLVGTSSSTAAIRDRMESGVGRWDEQYLAPYGITEVLSLIGKRVDFEAEGDLHRTVLAAMKRVDQFDFDAIRAARTALLLLGGFPELLTGATITGDVEDESDAWLLRSQSVLRKDAVERSIYKDIPQTFGINAPMKLERLLYILAGQIAEIVSPKTLSTDLEITIPTVERYVNYLEQSFLIFCLPNYSTSEETVQRRGRKLYFVDGAVRNAALYRGIGPLNDPAEMGHLLENMVASHLHALAEQRKARLFHWHHRRDEVDLVYDDPQSPMAFEVSVSKSHKLSGLTAFAKKYPKFENRCFFVSPDVAPLAPESAGGIGRIPLDLFLVAVGVQTERELAKRIAGR